MLGPVYSYFACARAPRYERIRNSFIIVHDRDVSKAVESTEKQREYKTRFSRTFRSFASSQVVYSRFLSAPSPSGWQSTLTISIRWEPKNFIGLPRYLAIVRNSTQSYLIYRAVAALTSCLLLLIDKFCKNDNCARWSVNKFHELCRRRFKWHSAISGEPSYDVAYYRPYFHRSYRSNPPVSLADSGNREEIDDFPT